jgi:hypothetical protein
MPVKVGIYAFLLFIQAQFLGFFDKGGVVV